MPPVTSSLAALYALAIKRLGRNARPDDANGVLDAETMGEVWSALLDGGFSPAQEAALLMGLRIHGESAAMLATAAQATLVDAGRVAAPAPAVVLHCFGSARRQPSLASLLALRLAALGTPVLVVVPDVEKSASSAGVLRALGRAPARSVEEASAQLAAMRLAWIGLAALAPRLARLIERRSELGFRNTAHTVVKLIAPVAGPAVVVANYTHAAYRQRLADAVQLLRANALLVRGTEGDPVVWNAEAHRPLAWIGGAEQPMEALPQRRAVLAGAPGDDIDTAALCRRAVDEGTIPEPIEQQAQALRRLAMLAGAHR